MFYISLIWDNRFIISILFAFDIIKSLNIIDTLLDHIGFELFAVRSQMLDHLAK